MIQGSVNKKKSKRRTLKQKIKSAQPGKRFKKGAPFKKNSNRRTLEKKPFQAGTWHRSAFVVPISYLIELENLQF